MAYYRDLIDPESAEGKRMKRIDELVGLDPPKDSAEGRELTRLVNEQLYAELGVPLP